MPSQVFYTTAETKGNPTIRDLSVAISVVQFPPLWDIEGRLEMPLKGTMVPAVQAPVAHHARITNFFLRLHPALSFARA